MSFARVEGHLNLYRDEKSGAILNFDNMSYNQYINSKKNKQLKAEQQKDEIENLKNEVSEIKSLLIELLNETRRN